MAGMWFLWMDLIFSPFNKSKRLHLWAPNELTVSTFLTSIPKKSLLNFLITWRCAEDITSVVVLK